MRSLVILLWALAASGASSPPAAGPTAGPTTPGVGAAVRSYISSAARGESYLLAGELNFLHKDRPRFHSFFVVAQGGDLDSSDMEALASLLAGGAPETHALGAGLCGFTPTYGLRLRGRGRPIDMLVSSDYARWCFVRGEKPEGRYLAESEAVRDSLGALIHRLFPNLGSSDGDR